MATRLFIRGQKFHSLMRQSRQASVLRYDVDFPSEGNSTQSVPGRRHRCIIAPPITHWFIRFHLVKGAARGLAAEDENLPIEDRCGNALRAVGSGAVSASCWWWDRIPH